MYFRFGKEEAVSLLPIFFDLMGGDLSLLSNFDKNDALELRATVEYLVDLGEMTAGGLDDFESEHLTKSRSGDVLSLTRLSSVGNFEFFFRMQNSGDTFIVFSNECSDLDKIKEFVFSKVKMKDFCGYSLSAADLIDISGASKLFLIADDGDGLNLVVESSLLDEKEILLHLSDAEEVLLSSGDGVEFSKYFAEQKV